MCVVCVYVLHTNPVRGQALAPMLSGGIICGRSRAWAVAPPRTGRDVVDGQGGEGGRRKKTRIHKTPNSVKRDLISCKKRPTVVSKETY